MNSLTFKTLHVYEIVSLYEIVISHYIKSWDSTARSREDERLEMVIGMQNEILDGHHRSLFRWLI